MNRLKLLVVGGAAVAALGAPATVLAESCANLSRPAPACNMTCSSPVIVGNWVWLPSIGADFPAWDFLPPGTTDTVLNGVPGAQGNYENIPKTSTSPFVEAWLLENSAICTKGIANRQGSHGIQSGCGLF